MDMSIKEELIQKIQNKTLVMGVCGLGYVGLPLAVDKAKHGFKTIGFDVQTEKVDMVNAGKNYIGDVVNADLEALVKDGRLSATTDFSFVEKVDFIAICVPTPLDKHQQPDISYVRDSTIAISKHLRRGSIVVLESTTYPGTTEELLRPILEEGSGLKCGEDFYLGFSPERVDPGNAVYKTSNTPKVVGAIGEDAADWPQKGVERLHALGFRTAAMALTDDSVRIDDARLAAEPRLAIVLGTEGDGLSPRTIAACDYTVKIPMAHGVDSLNVAAASAVAFWQLRTKMRTEYQSL